MTHIVTLVWPLISAGKLLTIFNSVLNFSIHRNKHTPFQLPVAIGSISPISYVKSSKKPKCESLPLIVSYFAYLDMSNPKPFKSFAHKSKVGKSPMKNYDTQHIYLGLSSKFNNFTSASAFPKNGSKRRLFQQNKNRVVGVKSKNTRSTAKKVR